MGTIRALACDLDDTLGPSGLPLSEEMITLLASITKFVPLVVVTGRDLAYTDSRVFQRLIQLAPGVPFVTITEGGAACSRWVGDTWHSEYVLAFSDDERSRIREMIRALESEHPELQRLTSYGQRIVERQGETAYAVLGIECPREIKDAWDPDNRIRSSIRDDLARRLPEFEVVLGGGTSIDIGHSGIDKAYGIKWLLNDLSLRPEELLYVGDSFSPEGNDFPVLSTGVRTYATKGPDDTYRFLNTTFL